MKKIKIVNLKGDDHKTKGRMGSKLTMEFSIWGGEISGAVTTLTSFCNLILEYDTENDDDRQSIRSEDG